MRTAPTYAAVAKSPRSPYLPCAPAPASDPAPTGALRDEYRGLRSARSRPSHVRARKVECAALASLTLLSGAATGLEAAQAPPISTVVGEVVNRNLVNQMVGKRDHPDAADQFGALYLLQPDGSLQPLGPREPLPSSAVVNRRVVIFCEGIGTHEKDYAGLAHQSLQSSNPTYANVDQPIVMAGPGLYQRRTGRRPPRSRFVTGADLTLELSA